MVKQYENSIEYTQSKYFSCERCGVHMCILLSISVYVKSDKKKLLLIRKDTYAMAINKLIAPSRFALTIEPYNYSKQISK